MSRLQIVFEDEDLYVVSKPAGLKVHGGAGQESLEAAAIAQAGQKLVLLHRLDRGTTGIVLFAKNREAATRLTQAFEGKKIRKAYLAIVVGRWRPEWNRVESLIEQGPENRMLSHPILNLAPQGKQPHDLSAKEPTPLDQSSLGQPKKGTDQLGVGKRSLTTFRLLAARDDLSLIEAIPKTGRKHQIRLHCSSLACPVFGDETYGGARAEFLALHAYRVDFSHPRTGELMRLTDRPPSSWAIMLSRFGGERGPVQIFERLFNLSNQKK